MQVYYKLSNTKDKEKNLESSQRKVTRFQQRNNVQMAGVLIRNNGGQREAEYFLPAARKELSTQNSKSSKVY